MDLFNQGENSHHKTTEIDDPTRLQFETNAKNQEAAVWSIMVSRKEPMTASQVHACYDFTGWPITSIRRAMTNLKKRGRLLKQKKTQLSPMGAPEHFYKVIPLVQK